MKYKIRDAAPEEEVVEIWLEEVNGIINLIGKSNSKGSSHTITSINPPSRTIYFNTIGAGKLLGLDIEHF